MARVFQLESTFGESADDYWHAGIQTDAERTVCGIAIDIDGDFREINVRRGYVTCPFCINTIAQIKAIRQWKKPS